MHKISPPSSFKNPSGHLRNLLTHEWYQIINGMYGDIFRLTSEFFLQEGIAPTLFPVTTGSVSSPMGLGSDSKPVKISIKGNDMYLADSMQFSLEIGARLNEKGAYYIMPTFRGEATDARHLNEFMHSEVEIKGDFEDILGLAERYMKFMTAGLLTTRRDDIIAIAGSVTHMEAAVAGSFKRIRYADAVRELQELGEGFDTLENGVIDITPIGERILMKRHGELLWLTHLPWRLVPFYQSQEPGNEEYSNTADLLAGIGEILGSGQRVFDGVELDESLAAHQVNMHGYEWYREMHDEFPLQTSGFGLGIERFILWALRHDDIRDCTLLLRDHDQVILP